MSIDLGKIDLGKFSNEHRTADGRTIYLAEAKNLVLRFNYSCFLEGTASLAKYDKVENRLQRIRGRINSPFPDFFRAWKIASTRKESRNRESFIFGGETTTYDTQLAWNMTGYDQWYYQSSLLNHNFSEDDGVTKEFIAEIFRPIDERVMEAYKNALREKNISN